MIHNSLLVRGLLASAALSFSALAALAQPRYTIQALPGLPGDTATVSYLSDQGAVAGSSGASPVGFVWRNGVTTPVGKLPKGQYSDATAISNTGVVVGDGDTGNGRPQSWVKIGTSLVNFFPNNGGNTHALFVSDSGWIGGYYTKSLGGWTSSWKGAIWLPDPKKPTKWTTLDLPVLPGGLNPKATAAFPSAFNQSGQVVGYYQNDLVGQRACFWNSDAAHTIVLLDRSPEYGSSLANSLNDQGQAVGQGHPPFGSRPLFWDNDRNHTVMELPLLPGDNYGAAIKINNLGHILGYSAYGEPWTWNIGPSRPILWREGGVYDLQSLLDPTTGAGWVVQSAVTLNNKGQILGTGTYNGQARVFLMTPLP